MYFEPCRLFELLLTGQGSETSLVYESMQYDLILYHLKIKYNNSLILYAGGIFIANNKERLDEYKRLGTIAKPFGIETYVLSPEETKKLYPLMNVDDIYGTLYSPGDGTIDPNGLCQALTRSATRAGCKVSL